MTSENTTDNMYEIVIFRTKGIDVRKGHRDDVELVGSHPETNLIVCDEFRHFIIGWDDKITIQTYTNSSWRVLLSMNPLRNYRVNYVGVRTHTDADWIVSDQSKSNLISKLFISTTR